jgi:protocatechuate 3,4-dioxygenase alpha subunit
VTNRDDDLVATASQTVGPFFDFGLTTPNAALGQMAGPDTPGERIRLRIRVYDGEGAVVPDAVVELWQADASGAFPGVWGRQGTDVDGACEFHTVRPGAAEGASHINVCLFARGLLRHIFTRIYFAGDPALSADPVLALVPEARRQTLLAHAESRPEGLRYTTADGDTWVFELRLQGEHETVFFDL